MTYKENVTAILECYFTGFKKEIIDSACNRILEQEPCEDAMNRILKRMWNCRGKHTTSIDKVKMELILRDELQSVNPQPKTGHWIDDEFGSKCSCCSIYTHLDKFDRPMKFRYCFMCGAKMVEPQESEKV